MWAALGAVQSGVGNALSRRRNPARRPARVFHAAGAVHRLLGSRTPSGAFTRPVGGGFRAAAGRGRVRGARAAAGVGFRHLWGRRKREELTRTAETEPGGLYDRVEPVLPLGLPFAPTAVSKEWFDWPALRLDRSIAERYADFVPTNPHAVALGMVGSLARQGSQCKKTLLWATRATCAVSSTTGGVVSAELIATVLTGVGVLVGVWRIFEGLRRDLTGRIAAVDAKLSARIDAVGAQLNTRIDNILLTDRKG